MLPPVNDGDENVVDLHPELARRVAALCADPVWAGRLKVDSGVRSEAEQRFLRDGWEQGKPGFNLAADPDMPMTPRYGLSSPRGSWHMAQRDGYGYAVDVTHSALTWPMQELWRSKVAQYGLWLAVPSELWHLQLPPDWLPPTSEEDDDMTPQEHDLLVQNNELLLGINHQLVTDDGPTLDKIMAQVVGIKERLTRIEQKLGVG